MKSSQIVTPRLIADNQPIEELMNPANFCTINELETKKKQELSSVGFYCLKLKAKGKLPYRYRAHLKTNHIVYIGIATTSLYNRLWKQELNAMGHGTLFNVSSTNCN